MELTTCTEPERRDTHDGRTCGRPARVLARWVWPSTHGPTEHHRVRCLDGHVTIRVGTPTAVERLPPLVTPDHEPAR